MTNFSQTITNVLAPVGGGTVNLWNRYNWNAFKWGSGSLVRGIGKLISESTSLPDTSISKQTYHWLNPESITPTEQYSKNVTKEAISETISTSADADYEYLQPGDCDWTYVFPSGATNLEDRDFVTWTSGAVASQTWADAANTPTSWSQQ